MVNHIGSVQITHGGVLRSREDLRNDWSSSRGSADTTLSIRRMHPGHGIPFSCGASAITITLPERALSCTAVDVRYTGAMATNGG